MQKANGQYRKSPRAPFIDYDSGNFFITICTEGKKHYFGEIVNGVMKFNNIGKFVDEQLKNAELYSNNIRVPIYVIMPNHIHAIVRICKPDMTQIGSDENNTQRCPIPSFRANSTGQRHVPELSRYVSSLKGVVSKYAKAQCLEFAWQTRYHDHLIRGVKDGNLISEYISNNVARWDMDCFYQ